MNYRFSPICVRFILNIMSFSNISSAAAGGCLVLLKSFRVHVFVISRRIHGGRTPFLFPGFEKLRMKHYAKKKKRFLYSLFSCSRWSFEKLSVLHYNGSIVKFAVYLLYSMFLRVLFFAARADSEANQALRLSFYTFFFCVINIVFSQTAGHVVGQVRPKNTGLKTYWYATRVVGKIYKNLGLRYCLGPPS